MILIADSGATKTAWSLIDGNTVFNFQTEGYHPFFVDAQYIARSLKKGVPDPVLAQSNQIKKIFFYSTGAGYSDETDAILRDGIAAIFNQSSITLETDLIAAARALLGHETGFAAILGTGSNSGLYNGSQIVRSVESGGFLLGDEGSGSYLGKMIINSFLRGYMPQHIKNAFEKQYQLTPEQIVNEVYASSQPNQYCARFAAFAGDHIADPFCKDLALANFDDFFKNIITRYEHYQNYTLHAVGSVVYNLKDIFETVAHRYGMKVGKVLPSVIDELVEYHKSLSGIGFECLTVE